MWVGCKVSFTFWLVLDALTQTAGHVIDTWARSLLKRPRTWITELVWTKQGHSSEAKWINKAVLSCCFLNDAEDTLQLACQEANVRLNCRILGPTIGACVNLAGPLTAHLAGQPFTASPNTPNSRKRENPPASSLFPTAVTWPEWWVQKSSKHKNNEELILRDAF